MTVIYDKVWVFSQEVREVEENIRDSSIISVRSVMPWSFQEKNYSY